MHCALKLLPKQALLCLCLLLFGISATAQTSKVEVLLTQLKSTDPDTIQIKVLRKLSAAYTSVDPIKKFYYANQYRLLAEKNNIDSNIANAYLDMGISYGVRSNLDSALYYFKIGQQKAKASGYQNGLARSLVNIGFVYDRSDKKQLAVHCYEDALKIFRRLNYGKGINQCITNLGAIYFDLKEYKSADNYFQQVLDNLKLNPSDELSMGNALFSLGGSKRRLKEFSKSMDYYQKSLAIREKIGDLNGIALSNWGISQLYVEKKDYKRALGYLDIALANNAKLKNAYQDCAMLITLTEAHLGLKDYEKADKAATLALTKAKETNSKIPIALALDNLSKVKAEKNEYESALNFKSQYIAINDSLETSKTTKEVILNDLHRVNTDNKNLEKRNETINAKITDYTTAIIIITVLLIVLIVLLVMYYKRNLEKNATNKLLQQQKHQIAEVNEELSALNEELKTQMEIVSSQNTELEKLNGVKNKFFSIVSHDLRGPIHSLKALFGMYRSGILNEDELGDLLERLEDTVYNTASFLDNLLEWSKSQLGGMVAKPIDVKLNEVITHNIKLMEAPIKLKSIRVENNVATDLTVFTDLNMVHVVIRNLLSNAIKFCSKGDEITFDAKIEQNQVVCSIKDTGPGISDLDKENLFNLTHQPGTGTSGEKGHHIGLILCRDMVLQNNGHLRVESKLGEGTTFYITLPSQG
ncbi:tetratricopeptide repeat-containing sensor histidine kinase [Pedobacter xixiisoli]|uniref:histidine kinase n=1 Tax=Pedobacter xixiisoli TaxID=1476464 RepID=A0A286A860_9SPHI|nr:tetratricopeptide repeat-containing sensor histidine kinase [Pedobacter xixiisoli]SOD18096.1 Signal transduction histidine kinase [Pedobacter xixiisoli]